MICKLCVPEWASEVVLEVSRCRNCSSRWFPVLEAVGDQRCCAAAEEAQRIAARNDTKHPFVHGSNYIRLPI